MKRLAAILALSGALGGCLTPSALNQSRELAGRRLSDAIARYGPPDQPVTEGAAAYSWSGGRNLGACKLTVRTGPDGRIARASVVAIGFSTCKSVLRQTTNG